MGIGNAEYALTDGVGTFAICEGYDQGDFAEKILTVSGPLVDDRVEITVPDGEIMYGELAEICVSAPGAECVELYYADRGYEWLGEGDCFTFELWPEESQYVCGGALYDGTWVFSDLMKLNVTSYMTLEKEINRLLNKYGSVNDVFWSEWEQEDHKSSEEKSSRTNRSTMNVSTARSQQENGSNFLGCTTRIRTTLYTRSNMQPHRKKIFIRKKTAPSGAVFFI